MINQIISCVNRSLHAATVVNVRKVNQDEYVVLVDRANMPDNRAYSTHKYSVNGDCLYYGHYDMSFDSATKSFMER